jgi:hypothetical protein
MAVCPRRDRRGGSVRLAPGRLRGSAAERCPIRAGGSRTRATTQQPMSSVTLARSRYSIPGSSRQARGAGRVSAPPRTHYAARNIGSTLRRAAPFVGKALALAREGPQGLGPPPGPLRKGAGRRPSRALPRTMRSRGERRLPYAPHSTVRAWPGVRPGRLPGSDEARRLTTSTPRFKPRNRATPATRTKSTEASSHPTGGPRPPGRTVKA